MTWGVFQVYIVLPLYILHVFFCFWVVPTKIACEYRFMDVSKLHIFSKTYLHALQYVTAWYYSKYRFMKINLIFKDYSIWNIQKRSRSRTVFCILMMVWFNWISDDSTSRAAFWNNCELSVLSTYFESLKVR